MAFNGADVVFVGTVSQVQVPKPWSRANADGSISVFLGTEPPVATFDVAHIFRGNPAQQLVIVGDGGDCDEPFKQGEAWLVYARSRGGRITTAKCTRTRLRAEASQDLVYLEGLEQRRPQGIVYGNVYRRIIGTDGRPALQALFEPLHIIALGAGRRVEITTDKWGPYELVLPPGDFEIWVERAGRAVAEKQTVHVDSGADHRLMLVADYTGIDLSGQWTLDVVATARANGGAGMSVPIEIDDGGAKAICGRVVILTQTSDRLLIERQLGDRSLSAAFELDGTESKHAILGCRVLSRAMEREAGYVEAPTEMTVTATWNGPTLTLRTAGVGGNGDVRQTLTILDDSLLVETTSLHAGEALRPIRSVYRKH